MRIDGEDERRRERENGWRSEINIPKDENTNGINKTAR